MATRTSKKKKKKRERSLRILVAEDHGVVRSALRALLEEVEGFEVCGEAANGDEALAKVDSLEPDLLLLDISLPKRDGIEVTRALVECGSPCRVVILSMHGDEEMVASAFAAGARGYVVKDERGGELEAAIRAVADGKHYSSPAATEALVQTVQESRADGGRPTAEAKGRASSPGVDRRRRRSRSGGGARRAPLSGREGQVLRLVASGLSTKQVASELEISPKTADAHRQALMRKLGIHDVAGLVKYALREGYTELD